MGRKRRVTIADKLYEALGDEIDASAPIGWVYCIGHPEKVDLFKIGKTGGSVGQRLSVLNTSEVEDFFLYWSVLVYDYHAIERALHYALGEWRVSARKEFFRFDTRMVWPLKELIIDVAGVDMHAAASMVSEPA